MQCIAETHPDIVFLDIEMNSHNGIALARTIPGDICIIFTTAYAHYALDGFNVDAVDFLHKPVFYSRFEHSMEKARMFMSLKKGSRRRDTIRLKVEYKTVVLDVSEISHIEAMDNYVKVYREGLPTIVSQITMKEVMSMLPEDRFVRVHRSFIVALDAIEKFSTRQVFLRTGGQAIPVGRTYADAVSDAYSRNQERNAEER